MFSSLYDTIRQGRVSHRVLNKQTNKQKENKQKKYTYASKKDIGGVCSMPLVSYVIKIRTLKKEYLTFCAQTLTFCPQRQTFCAQRLTFCAQRNIFLWHYEPEKYEMDKKTSDPCRNKILQMASGLINIYLHLKV